MTRESANMSMWSAYDLGAAVYAKAGEDDPAWRSTYRDRFRCALRGSRVVDLGSGPGFDAKHFDDGTLKCTAVDASPNMLAHVRDAAPDVATICADALSLSHVVDKVAGIWAMFLIIHISPDDISSCFRDWRNALDEDGVLVLSGVESTKITMRWVDDWLGIAGNRCLFYYHSLRVTRAALENAGFRVEWAEYNTPCRYQTEKHRGLGLETFVLLARRA